MAASKAGVIWRASVSTAMWLMEGAPRSAGASLSCQDGAGRHGVEREAQAKLLALMLSSAKSAEPGRKTR